jgi:hypothetical protein
VQITPICVTLAGSYDTREDASNGGSARGYQELSAPLAIPTTAEQAGGQDVCFSLSHKRCASVRAGLVPGIMVYAAELPLSAA